MFQISFLFILEFKFWHMSFFLFWTILMGYKYRYEMQHYYHNIFVIFVVRWFKTSAFVSMIATFNSCCLQV